jgi:Flp pilus assembly protein TadD
MTERAKMDEVGPLPVSASQIWEALNDSEVIKVSVRCHGPLEQARKQSITVTVTTKTTGDAESAREDVRIYRVSKTQADAFLASFGMATTDPEAGTEQDPDRQPTSAADETGSPR